MTGGSFELGSDGPFIEAFDGSSTEIIALCEHGILRTSEWVRTPVGLIDEQKTRTSSLTSRFWRRT